jgi:hypothetical protein
MIQVLAQGRAVASAVFKGQVILSVYQSILTNLGLRIIKFALRMNWLKFTDFRFCSVCYDTALALHIVYFQVT